MDGYEYAVKVLYPAWNREPMSQQQNMKDRLKEIGLEIKKDPVEIQMNLGSKIVKNPDNFYPELSPNYELMKSTRKSKY